MSQFVRSALFVILTFSATMVSADYVCETSMNPGSSTLGDYGYIYAIFYSGANCTGSWVTAGYLCSSGATNTVCSTNLLNRYTSAEQLAAAFAPIAQAAGEDYPVQITLSLCPGGAATCLAYIRFH